MRRATRDLAITVAGVALVAVVASQPWTGDTGTPGPDSAPTVADAASGTATLPVPDDDLTWTAEIVRVSDGDTVVVRVTDPRGTGLEAGHEVRVRLLRVDTPELARDGQPEECWAREATTALSVLLPPGSTATLQYDQERQDQYGRELAHAWNQTGRWVNGALLLDGHADVITFPPNTAHDDLVHDLEQLARSEGRGRWAACA